MKNIILLLTLILTLSGCGPHMYYTASKGKENVSYITVLTSGAKYQNVQVEVDGKSFPIKELYTVDNVRKADRIVITPGKHNIKVVADGKTVSEELIFIGLDQTKQIIL